MRALITFASEEGQTEKIAGQLARQMQQAGLATDICEVTRVQDASIQVESYDVMVAGSPVHYERCDKDLADWIMAHHTFLRTHLTAFFSVSLGILGDSDSVRAVEAICQDYLDEARWHPNMLRHFSGALAYRKYPWWKRWLMRRVAAKAGGPTDTSRDHDLTDWTEVRQFALEIAKQSKLQHRESFVA